MEASGLPARVLITEGTRADCTQASALIEGIDADDWIADQGYDTDTILEQAAAQGMNVVLPPKTYRNEQRPYNKELYKLRHQVENTFLILKKWRGIATCYAKNSASFLAAVLIRCLTL